MKGRFENRNIYIYRERGKKVEFNYSIKHSSRSASNKLGKWKSAGPVNPLQIVAPIVSMTSPLPPPLTLTKRGEWFDERPFKHRGKPLIVIFTHDYRSPNSRINLFEKEPSPPLDNHRRYSVQVWVPIMESLLRPVTGCKVGHKGGGGGGKGRDTFH